MKHVTIIGGGITGLAAAFYLQRYARDAGMDIAYTLLEADSRWGGKVTSHHEKHFTIEGGPDSFITQKPWGLELCRDLGIEDQLIPSNDAHGAVFIYYRERLERLPEGFRLAIPTKMGPLLRTRLLSWKGKIRMAAELLVKPRTSTDDESLAQFATRRFGREALDRVAGPIMAGIYMADPEKLSMKSTFPQFHEMERKHGSLIRALVRQKRKAKRSSVSGSGMFNSLSTGMGTLVDALLAQLTGDLRKGQTVEAIERTDTGYRVVADGSPIQTDAIVLAVPSRVAAKLLRPLHQSLADELEKIRYISSATVSLAYREEDLPPPARLDGFGIIIPRSERRDAMACTWSSNKFSNRAPDGHVLIRVFLGGDSNEASAEQADEKMIEMARKELERFVGITAEPIVSRAYRWTHANPQYDVGHLERVQAVEQLVDSLQGLRLAGSAYHGVGIPDCIRSAQTAARNILDRRPEQVPVQAATSSTNQP